MPPERRVNGPGGSTVGGDIGMRRGLAGLPGLVQGAVDRAWRERRDPARARPEVDVQDERRPDVLPPPADASPNVMALACAGQLRKARSTRIGLSHGWQVEVLSGAGGKLPAAILLQTPHWRVLLDAGASLEPDVASISREAWVDAALQAPLDAVLISHDHVDHIGAVGQLPREVPVYATAAVAPALPADTDWRPLPLQGQVRLEKVGAPSLVVRTGASGHSLGGVWLHVSAPGDLDGGLFYSGDMSLESRLFQFDVPPRAELALVDASYGRDDTRQSQRLSVWQELLASLNGPLVLPVPTTGRALEMALWLREHGHALRLDDECRQVLQRALQSPPGQFAPGAARRLAELAAHLDAQPDQRPQAVNASAAEPVTLLADPAPDGRPGAELAALLADPSRCQTIVYTGYCPPPPAGVRAPGIHVLRWNVHPRLRDLATLLALTQARCWLPLFTPEEMPERPGECRVERPASVLTNQEVPHAG